MCYTQGASLALSTAAFLLAAYEHRRFKCWQYSFGIAYWGIMELLQVVQHSYAAGPEDDYAMCANRTNQYLTKIGNVHIILQPVVLSLSMMSMYRRHDLEARIIGDFVFRLALLAALWFPSYSWICHLMGVPMELRKPATEDCPNYDWLMEGYDGYLKQTTPNIPGQPCVYYAPTESGHLAWVIPSLRQMYWFPSPNTHFFIFFAPYMVMSKWPIIQCFVFFCWLTGPYLAYRITPSVNEQAAVWCFYSVFQAISYAIVVRWKKLYEQPFPSHIHHAGTRGEVPVTYILQDKPASPTANGTATATTNGEGEQILPLVDDPKHI